jgi:DNA-binding beta-propeller fold protein YncE
VAVDPDGTILVCEIGNRCIQKFAVDFTPLETWRDGIGFNQGLGRIAIGPDRHIYVTQLEVRVFHLDPDGYRVNDWRLDGTGGSTPYDILGGISVDAGNHVYVSDGTLGHIQKFDPAGNLLLTWGGSRGSSCSPPIFPGMLCHPAGIALDGSEVFVANTWSWRIEVFGDAPTPALPASWGSVKARYR